MTYLNTISHWYGRLGNNIQQICNAVMFSKFNGDGFFSPPHELIDQVTFDYEKRTMVRSGRFFHYNTANKDFDLDMSYIYSNIRSVALEYVRPKLKVEFLESYDDSVLVIHIRSGDIFEHEHNPPHDYVPNPLLYYLVLIEEFDKVIVVTEPDDYNPIVHELKKNDKVTVQSLSVSEDFSTLLRAKNLASSGTGTFAVAAALCSTNIKNFYCSNLYLNEHLNPDMLIGGGMNVHMMNLDNYIQPRTWKNNQEQRKFILEYQA